MSDAPTCPFPELKQFSDADIPAAPGPFRAGDYWCATDGKILAWRRAEDGITEPNPAIPVAHLLAAINAISGGWLSLPAEMPQASETTETCTECRGIGTVPKEVDCDDCGGTGECHHCGHECEECDGDGVIESKDAGEPCPRCGGARVMPCGPSWILVGLGCIAWRYAATLVRLKAQVVWNTDTGRTVLAWRNETLTGFVMPLHLPKEPGALTPQLLVQAAS